MSERDAINRPSLTDAQFTTVFSRLPFEHSVIALLIRFEGKRLTQCLRMTVRDGLLSGIMLAQIQALRRKARTGVKDEALLFVAQDDGEIKISTIQKSMNKAGKDAGMKRKITPRALASVKSPLD